MLEECYIRINSIFKKHLWESIHALYKWYIEILKERDYSGRDKLKTHYPAHQFSYSF